MTATTGFGTCLPDRETLRAALDQAIAAGEGVALAVLDVDRCAGLDERFGREATVQVLETLQSLLAAEAPGQAYRLGADEFAVFMPAVSLEQAFLRIEELRRRVGEAQERFGLPEGGEVTIGAGVAHAPRDARDAASLLQAAGAALAAAKEAGGNQVALPSNEEMVMKSCYYSASSLRRLKTLAERQRRRESELLREALDDLLHKHDRR